MSEKELKEVAQINNDKSNTTDKVIKAAKTIISIAGSIGIISAAIVKAVENFKDNKDN